MSYELEIMSVFKKDKKQISLFTTAGYPKLTSLDSQLKRMEQAGVDFVEVGIPFSDPLADGPVIQETSSIAIRNGMNMSLLFDQLKERTSTIPVVLMGYLNPVLSYGLELFLSDARDCKIQSVILPDMSVEIYERFYKDQFEAFGIYPSFLITPKTETGRIKRVAKLCRNSFVYLVSTNATTGSELTLENRLKVYAEIYELCGETPVFIGFGIKSRRDVEVVQSVVDGAIIGSAYLRAISSGTEHAFLAEITEKSTVSFQQ